MSLTIIIGTTNITTVENASVEYTSDGRSTATITVRDLAGAYDFQPRTSVTINDSTNNYSFEGVVNDSQKTPDADGTALIHTVNCVDASDTAGKRYYSGPEWQNRTAGDIATDLVANVLSAEGITANYAID